MREAAIAATGNLSPMMGTDAQPAAIGIFAQRVAQQALVMTFNDLLLMLSILVASLALLLPLIEKPRPQPGAEGAAH